MGNFGSHRGWVITVTEVVLTWGIAYVIQAATPLGETISKNYRTSKKYNLRLGGMLSF
jgi:hypothetical protein